MFFKGSLSNECFSAEVAPKTNKLKQINYSMYEKSALILCNSISVMNQ